MPKIEISVEKTFSLESWGVRIHFLLAMYGIGSETVLKIISLLSLSFVSCLFKRQDVRQQ